MIQSAARTGAWHQCVLLGAIVKLSIPHLVQRRRYIVILWVAVNGNKFRRQMSDLFVKGVLRLGEMCFSR